MGNGVRLQMHFHRTGFIMALFGLSHRWRVYLPMIREGLSGHRCFPWLKYNTLIPTYTMERASSIEVPVLPTNSMPLMPTSHSPLLPHLSPAENCISPPDPGIRKTAFKIHTAGAENRDTTAPMQIPQIQRKDSPFPYLTCQQSRLLG